MKIDIRKENGISVALLKGEIDHHNAQELRRELDNYIITEQPKELAMDFRNITFMDSSGIGLIIGRCRLLKECGGKLTVSNPQGYIRRVMKLSGIEKIVRITGERI